MASPLRNALMLLAITAAAGAITAVPERSVRMVPTDTLGGSAEVGDLPEDGMPRLDEDGHGGSKDGTPDGGPGKQGPTGHRYECAPGKNGGSTEKGVTATSINLASTIVTSGPGSTFLGQSQYGLQAVVAKVNAGGGICGRSLRLRLVNDNWEAQRGHQFLRNFINDPAILALPVVPSSEGLLAASREIAEAGVPVIGSDGMLIDQYQNRWIWPVATATVSQMRILAKHAYDQGSRGFGIVYDKRYKFGVEGKTAYEQYVRSLPGARLVHAEGIEPGQPGYGPEIDRVSKACGQSSCEAMVMLLDPGTAEVWVAGDDKFSSRSKYRLGAQPLFNDRFGQNCRDRCDGMIVVSGYVPPLEGNSSLPGIRTYVQDVKAVQPNADVTNQFLEGAYLGMTVFVEVLKRVGPNLTRAALRQTMDSFDFESDLSGPLSWRPDKRFANTRAQAWRMRASSSFDGFQDLRTGWLNDPNG